MTKIVDYIGKTEIFDRDFVGTIAFRSEEITLPNNSKMALGIDDGHWVLVFQKEPKAPFQIFEYDNHSKKIAVDKKPGQEKDLKTFQALIKYFLTHAAVEDLITIMPSHGEA